MVYEKIDKMISGELEHSNIIMTEQISYSDSSSSYGYGEYNGFIIDLINEFAHEPVVFIFDNVIKFIEYLPSKLENEHYHSIKQKEFPINFSFNYYTIKNARKRRDYELLDFMFQRVDKEIDKLLKDPYYLFKKEEKGLASAYCCYIDSALDMSAIHDEERDRTRDKLIQLEKIYGIY